MQVDHHICQQLQQLYRDLLLVTASIDKINVQRRCMEQLQCFFWRIKLENNCRFVILLIYKKRMSS